MRIQSTLRSHFQNFIGKRSTIGFSSYVHKKEHFYNRVYGQRTGGWANTLGMKFSTSFTDKKESESVENYSIISRAVSKINIALLKYPQESLFFLFASDIGSIFLTNQAFNLVGMEFSSEFALAFATSRLLRKFRLPLDVASAAILAKLIPDTTKINLSSLMNAVSGTVPMPSKTSMLGKGAEKAQKIIDKYGAAYLIGSRFMGVAVVFSLYFGIKQGLDLSPILATFGMEDAGTTLGSWAAAVVLSSSLYPVTLGLTGYVVPVIGKFRGKLAP